ncbi:T9SS type A sorting domain-containing protein [Candidatus Latescibacterota bacterium]
MKIIAIITILFSFLIQPSYAANFIPSQLKLSTAGTVQHNFDGSSLDIPVTVSGTAATVIFSVYTREMAHSIVAVQNGYLGWHYVNKVDTAIYIGPEQLFDMGRNTITWDGKDSDGGQVPAGDYTYYLWAFDHVSAKTLVSTANIYPIRSTYIEEYGTDGIPLEKPLFLKAFGALKWEIGSDPEDLTHLETCELLMPEEFRYRECIALDPTDQEYFFTQVSKREDGSGGAVWRYQWVPNGQAVRDESWGDDEGEVLTPIGTPYKHGGSGVTSDGDYLYTTKGSDVDADISFYIISLEGELLNTIELADRWAKPDDADAGGQMVGGPNNNKERHGIVFLNSHGSCIKTAVNPASSLDEEEDFWVWANDNGDYIVDHNFEEDAQKPWVCNDFNVGPYCYNISPDDNLFTILPAYDMGAVSFALLGPDGTGIGYYSYAGENANIKWGNAFVDCGSAYDGIYTDNNSTGAEEKKQGLWYIAHDSIKGVITSANVSVTDDTPVEFSVTQNTPNPFNPSTTISFTIADAGNVSVEVFNMAGQTIDTIIKEFMNAGNHSVTWDATKFSAGVYFYTVETRNFSKTMKMTLIK